jgi:hypothetical protein
LLPVQAKASTIRENSSDGMKALNCLISEQLDDLNTNDWTPFLKYVEEEGFDFLEGESASEVIRRLISGHFTFSGRFSQ